MPLARRVRSEMASPPRAPRTPKELHKPPDPLTLRSSARAPDPQVPELLGRDPDAVRERWLSLQPAGDAERARAFGLFQSPTRLEDWVELEDGSFEGRLFFCAGAAPGCGDWGLCDGAVVRTRPIPAAVRCVDESHVSPSPGVFYELGQPRAASASVRAGDGGVDADPSIAAAATTALAGDVAPLAGKVWSGLKQPGRAAMSAAAATAAASAALGVVGHHLSVHFFWA